VHAVLANMAPVDPHHFVYFRPAHGFINEWDVKESTTIRMTPRTQVAGAAKVADAVVVLQTLVTTGYAGILQNMSQINALMAAHRELEAEGMRCASYAAWYFNNHPTGTGPTRFSQRDAGFIGLIEEAAIAVTRLFPGSTISASATLRSSANESSNEAARTLWGGIAAAQGTANEATVMTALERIMGSSAQSSLVNLASGDAAQVRAGVTGYNQALTDAATALGMAAPPSIDVTRVLTRAGLPTTI